MSVKHTTSMEQQRLLHRRSRGVVLTEAVNVVGLKNCEIASQFLLNLLRKLLTIEPIDGAMETIIFGQHEMGN